MFAYAAATYLFLEELLLIDDGGLFYCSLFFASLTLLFSDW
jgi:hypothetical protein